MTIEHPSSSVVLGSGADLLPFFNSVVVELLVGPLVVPPTELGGHDSHAVLVDHALRKLKRQGIYILQDVPVFFPT